jgi:hypothetical protein
MPQKATAPAADRGGEEILVVNKLSSTLSNSHSQAQSGSEASNAKQSHAEDSGVSLAQRIAKVRKAMAPTRPSVSWREVLKVHPAADKLRPASDDERRALRGDLKEHGQIEPVLLFTIDGGPTLLGDGRTRLDLLEDNGVDVVTAGGELLVPHKVISRGARSRPWDRQRPGRPMSRPIIQMFTARCQARALLWEACVFDLHEAVDTIQTWAVSKGLVAEVGQDRIQAIMAAAFQSVRA